MTSVPALDYVALTHGLALIEIGHPQVPRHPIEVDVNAGARTRDVTLAGRYGLSETTEREPKWSSPLVPPDLATQLGAAQQTLHHPLDDQPMAQRRLARHTVEDTVDEVVRH